jgi:hypothetical protein
MAAKYAVLWTRSIGQRVMALPSPKGGTPIKGDTPMDNRTARNKEVSDRAKKLEAQIMGHMFDMCWPEFIAYCHEVGWRADRIDAGDAKAKVKARVVEPFR